MRRRELLEGGEEPVNLTLSSYGTSLDSSYGGSGSFNVYNNGVALDTNDYTVSVRNSFLTSYSHSGSTVSFSKSGSSHQTSTKYCYIDVTYKGVTKTHSVSQAADSLSSSYTFSVEEITSAAYRGNFTESGTDYYYYNLTHYMTGTFKTYSGNFWKDGTLSGSLTYIDSYTGEIRAGSTSSSGFGKSGSNYYFGITPNVSAYMSNINGHHCKMISSTRPKLTWSGFDSTIPAGEKSYTRQKVKKMLSTNQGQSVGSETTSNSGTGTTLLDFDNMYISFTWNY